ncbi:MAG: FtsW/RodA/SpoVE family cell cycle protein, partial [Bacillota bacterium]|nr:FtsW/RodA/SpoVE family cell cycle protein [Bacillota bacterium]
MKKKRKGKLGEVDFILICTILILLGIGLVMVFSASSWNTAVLDNDPMYYFKKQLLWAGIGLVFMVAAMLIDYHIIKRFTLILMVVCAFLLFVVFKFGAVNGATRWIDLGGASLQPSEIVKYAVVFY